MSDSAFSHRLVLRPYIRGAAFLFGTGGIALAVGFLMQTTWAVNLWPYLGYYDDPNLLYDFLAAVSAGIGAGALWIAFSGDLSAAVGAGIDLLLTCSGAAIFLQRSYQQDGDPFKRSAAVVFAVLALLMLVTAAATLRFPVRDTRTLPVPIRLALMPVGAALVIGGILMLLGTPDVYPWDLTPETAALYGWIYLGASCYVAYALIRPAWLNARGLLAGFLVYDLVLLPPFVAQVGLIDPARRPSLLLYIAVLIVSAALACYYLFINSTTRGLRAERLASRR
jgi:hypothetical protein